MKTLWSFVQTILMSFNAVCSIMTLCFESAHISLLWKYTNVLLNMIEVVIFCCVCGKNPTARMARQRRSLYVYICKSQTFG